MPRSQIITPDDVEHANAITAVGRERGKGEDDMVRVEARLRFEDTGHDYLVRKAA